MRPVRTASSNLVYRGPTPDIGDLHCQRIERGRVRAVYWLTPEERLEIAEGRANIAIVYMTEPIPATSIGVTEEQGIGEDAPEVLVRLELLRQTPGVDR